MRSLSPLLELLSFWQRNMEARLWWFNLCHFYYRCTSSLEMMFVRSFVLTGLDWIGMIPASPEKPSGREEHNASNRYQNRPNSFIHISPEKARPPHLHLQHPLPNPQKPPSLISIPPPTTSPPSSPHPSPSDHTIPDSPTLPSRSRPNRFSLQFAHEPHESIQCVLATCLRFRLRALRFLPGCRKFGFGDSRLLRRWRRG